jgi:hypothetical protein
MKLIICFFLLVSGFAPEPILVMQKFETLLCRQWKLSFLEKNGQSRMPEEIEREDRMTFDLNNIVEIVKKGEGQDAIWQYDAKKILILTDRVTKDRTALKIISLTKDEFVIEPLDANHTRMHLIPVKE